MGATQELMEIKTSIDAAMSYKKNLPSLMGNLFRLLEIRSQYANDYIYGKLSESNKDACIEGIKYINEEIKKLLAT